MQPYCILGKYEKAYDVGLVATICNLIAFSVNMRKPMTWDE